MVSKVEDHLTISVTRKAVAITRTGFGIPLIVDTGVKITGDYQSFANLAAVDEVFLTTDAARQIAADIFAQSPQVGEIIIMKRAANVKQLETVTVDTAEDTTVYSCTINGTLFDITSDGDATVVEIAAALKVDIDLGVEPVTVVDNIDGTYTIETDVAGVPFTLAVDSNQSFVSTTPNKNVATEIARIQELIDTWYGILLVPTDTEAEQLLDIEQMAAWTEDEIKQFVYSNDQSTMLTTATDDILSILQDGAYSRSIGFYHDIASFAGEFVEGAAVGRVYPFDPGFFTWKFLNLDSITVDALTSTQKTNLKAKNGNYFENLAGQNIITSDAKTADGTFIDLIRSTDWIQINVGEALMELLILSPKVVFTEQGLGLVEARIYQVLNQAVTLGILIEGSPTVTVPALADLAAADIQNRDLKGVTFGGTFVQAIHEGDFVGEIALAPAA